MNNDQLTDLLSAARSVNWKKEERRLRVAIARAKSEKPRRDGMPSSTLGGGGSSSDVPDPTFACVVRPEEADPLGAKVRRAIDRLRRMVDDRDAFIAELDRIDSLADAPDVPGCALLAQHGVWEPVFKDGLGVWAYKFRARRRREGNERLPNTEEVQAHLAGKRVS